MSNQGLVYVVTGDGKGKTTSALGIALRARAHEKKVCIVYFHKDVEKWGYKEQELLTDIGVKVYRFASSHPFCDIEVSQDTIRKECMQAVECVRQIFQERRYEIVILDEICISVRDGFLKEQEVVDLIAGKPDSVSLIITGRGATEKMCAQADLVSRIENVKHPFDKGVAPIEGIDF